MAHPLDNLAYLGPNNLKNAPLSYAFKSGVESVQSGLENSALNNVAPKSDPINQGPLYNTVSTAFSVIGWLFGNWQIAIIGVLAVVILLNR